MTDIQNLAFDGLLSKLDEFINDEKCKENFEIVINCNSDAFFRFYLLFADWHDGVYPVVTTPKSMDVSTTVHLFGPLHTWSQTSKRVLIVSELNNPMWDGWPNSYSLQLELEVDVGQIMLFTTANVVIGYVPEGGFGCL